jgi:hypothetical protein
LGPGQTFYESPDDIHVVSKNASDPKPAKFLVFFVKDKALRRLPRLINLYRIAMRATDISLVMRLERQLERELDQARVARFLSHHPGTVTVSQSRENKLLSITALFEV